MGSIYLMGWTNLSSISLVLASLNSYMTAGVVTNWWAAPMSRRPLPVMKALASSMIIGCSDIVDITFQFIFMGHGKQITRIGSKFMGVSIIILIKLEAKQRKLTMDRDIPVFNRPVMQKIFRKNQQKHLERLRNIKSGNSNRTMPINPPNNHTLSNKKAVLAEEQKRTEIEKQNVLLFNKMMRIMKRNDPHNQANMTQLSRANRGAFQNSRIQQENRGILERIQQQRPTISNKKLQEDRMKNLNILRFLGKYPNAGASRINYDTTSSQMGRKSQTKRKYESFYNRGGQNVQEFELDEEAYDNEIRNYQDQIQKLKQRNHSSSGRRKYMSQAVNRNCKVDSEESQGLAKLASVDVPNQMPHLYQQFRVQQRQQSKASAKSQYSEGEIQRTNFSNAPSKEIILFQKNTHISKHIASVQFIRLYNIYKIKAIFQQPVRGNRVYELEIPENQGNEFFSDNNYDYNKICKMLVIEDGCLVVNPNLFTEQEQRTIMEAKPSQKMLVSKTGETNKIQSVPQDQHWAKYEQALQQYIE